MDEEPDAPTEGQDPEKVVREPTEGVRIIGAEEAAEAAGRRDVVSRLPGDRPRFGERPTPADDTPPPLDFPAPASDDPNTFGAVPIISADTPPPPGIGGSPAETEIPGLADLAPPEGDEPTAPVSPAAGAPGPTMASDEDDLGRMLGGRRDRKDETSGGRRSRRGRRRGRRDEAATTGAFDDLLPPADEPVAEEDHDLPHWTRPPTGEVPKVLAAEPGDEEVWSGLGAQPRWRDDPARDEADDFSDLHDQTRVDPVPTAADEPEVVLVDDFGAIPPPPARPSAPAAPVDEAPAGYEPEPAYQAEPGPQPGYEPEPGPQPGYEPEPGPAYAPEPEPSVASSAPYPEPRHQHRPLGGEPGQDDGGGAGRDLPMAAMVGAGLFVGYLLLSMVGTAAVTLLVLVVIVMAVIEFFNAVRRVGYHPAVLPGLVATACFVLAVHWKGEPAFLLVTFLTVVVLMLWYVVGLQHERAVANIGITLLGVLWIGGLGSFAGLLLALPHGTGLLFAAVFLTVAYDVGAYAVGRQFGKTPLSPASPNKTYEGLAGGAAVAVVLGALVLGVVPGVFPWEFMDALVLGLAVAVAAPVGDLCESMLKRDLGIKDMGSILPGHGGLLDRFDALLFVLPVTYYVVRLLDVLANTP